MLLAHTSNRKPFDIRALDESDVVAKLLRHQTCYMGENPADARTTYFAIRGKFSNVVHDVVLPITFKKFSASYAAWVNGTFIQEAFDMFDSSVREFIQTGTTPEEWDELMGAEK